MSKQGKGARRRSKEKRMNAKRARKAAMRAQYQAWALAGQNKKSKRNRNKKQNIAKLHNHATSNCGNLGCSICYDFSNPWLAKVTSSIYSKRWTSPIWKNKSKQYL